MIKPPQELVDAFFKWYSSDPHSKNEDYYGKIITKNHLSGLSKSEFIEFFYQFAHEGGKVQSGGYRTSSRFRETIENQYDGFRQHVLEPFDSDFDVANWLLTTKSFVHFGIGLATIYLNRVDKKRFTILNNKVADSLALLEISLPSDSVKRYRAVIEAQQQLLSWFPQFDNFYRADALNQFLIGEEEGQPWKRMLEKNGSGEHDLHYWTFQGNPKNYDVIGALRDSAVKSWSLKQHKKEIKAGDRVIIWVTGENSGCYGVATVTSGVQTFEEDAKEASYWIRPTEKVASEGVTIRLDTNLWNAPVLRTELDNLSNFSDFPAGKQGTNLKITEDHFKGIQGLILGRTQMRYWVYAPGPNAKFWDECWQKRIMVYGADELADLQTYESKDAIEKALKKALGLKGRPTNDALAAWEFSRVVKPGDVIIAKRGRQQYIGYGIVTGPYIYDTSRATYRNVRTMRWVKKGQWNEAKGPIVLKTLTDITKYPEYVEKLKKLIGIDPPPPQDQPYDKNKAMDGLFLAEAQFDEMLTALREKKNLVLQGAPGVGKTYVAKRLAYALIGSNDPQRIEMIQFHQSYSYEDFIQGFRPTPEGHFDLRYGIFHHFCRRAQREDMQGKPYVFIIDEINRGNLSKIFGELMMLIEPDKRGKEFAIPLAYSQDADEKFYIPENLHLIGMMNTADRSLAMVDYALRRRFRFITLRPEFSSEGFQRFLGDAGAKSELVKKIVTRMNALNEVIAADNKNLGPGYQIGHSYFCPRNSIDPDEEWYRRVIESEIVPLIREYWFDNEQEVEDRRLALLA